MTDQAIQRYAKDLVSFVLQSFKDGDDYTDTVKQVEIVIRLAIKESSEEKDEVICRLSLATDSDFIVGSCDCMAKTPGIEHHKKGCKYRLIAERDDALLRLRDAKAEVCNLADKFRSNDLAQQLS